MSKMHDVVNCSPNFIQEENMLGHNPCLEWGEISEVLDSPQVRLFSHEFQLTFGKQKQLPYDIIFPKRWPLGSIFSHVGS